MGSDNPVRNIALTLRYDGTAYHGWQVQKNQVTVAETVEHALEAVVKHRVKVVGCGRTDAGVHAERYIANFRTRSAIPVDRLPLALNSQLPRDISSFSAVEVPIDFNSIACCARKEYTYRMYTGRFRDPFLANRAHFYPFDANLELMTQSAMDFVGVHDFASMQTTGTNVLSTVREVFWFNVSRNENLFEFKVCANGFLYNMVRSMVGTLLYVSEGKIRSVAEVLEARDRKLAGPTAPACGLYMTGAWYKEIMT